MSLHRLSFVYGFFFYSFLFSLYILSSFLLFFISSRFSINSLLFFIFLLFSSPFFQLSPSFPYLYTPLPLSTSLFASFFLLFSPLSLIIFYFSFPLCSIPFYIYALPPSYAHKGPAGRVCRSKTWTVEDGYVRSRLFSPCN